MEIVSELKAKFSAKLRRVQAGQVLAIADKKHPIAYIAPLANESLLVREAADPYTYRDLSPPLARDPFEAFAAERKYSL
jgi:antitoxin (DNA-binding transcriptional repressor) of toxin-antitoxin stability system